MTLTRRAILQLSVLAAGALLGSSSADARKLPRVQIELWYGTELANPEPGSLLVMRWGKYPSHARPVERVAPAKIELASKTNDNSKFALHVVLPHRTDPLSRDGRLPLARYFLRVAGQWHWPTGGGRTKGADLVDFELDRATALALGRHFNVAVAERQPLDKDIGFAWNVQPAGTTTSPIAVELQLANHGTTTVATSLHPGSFHFELVHADGTRARRRNPRRLSTGSTPYSTLGPGGGTSLLTDLHDHLIVDRPGTYVLTATYTGALTNGSGIRAPRWDITQKYSTTIVIK